MDLKQEIERRRTFAIISHPDAGKTTLTEKLLLYGGAIQLAGSVKGKATARHAVSDWMELEKQRGISITSSVMQFEYEGYCINILDTPGHQDFSEDTYRTLMAADSAVMVIDAAKGIEPQTRKLFKICAMRHIPIFTFINKLDREARDPFELMEQLENEFGIGTYPVNWPIGCGHDFKGVFDRDRREILAFQEFHRGQNKIRPIECELTDVDRLDELIGPRQREKLTEDIELLDGAGYAFDLDEVRAGRLSPVFFGSALTNFGVEPFLENFLHMTMPPLPRTTADGVVDPIQPAFSAFVFKIQANMNPAHRDRLAFFRICSGTFTRGMSVTLSRTGKQMKLSQSTHLMANDRETVETAIAGDIIGIYDSGNFQIGDTLTDRKEKLFFEPLPTFPPELFCRVRPVNSLKAKQFQKGVQQLAQEGAIQVYHNEFNDVILGAVGQLQFEVFQYRLLNEYNSEIRMEPLEYQVARWVAPGSPKDVKDYVVARSTLVYDHFERPILLFANQYTLNNFMQKNPEVKLVEALDVDDTEHLEG